MQTSAIIVTDNLLTVGPSHGRTGQSLTPSGIVVHYVGNPGSTALANRNYFENGSGGAGVSAHYIVGLNGEIIRCIPENERAMHAGKSYAAKYDTMAAANNSKFIGIENCHPYESGKFNDLTYNSLVGLVSDICLRRGFQIKDIYRHYDVCGKNCPKYYVDYPNEWYKFLNDVSSYIVSKLAATPIVNININLNSAAKLPAVEQAEEWARKNNASQTFISLAKKYYSNAPSRGNVNPAIAYCQAAKETGFGRFGGVLDESYCNPCGMKTKEGGGDYDKNAHQKFADWDTGIRAHLDHLALYAGAAGYPLAATSDPRHFKEICGTAPTVEELGGKWAGSLYYGKEIVGMYSSLSATVVSTTSTSISVSVSALTVEDKLAELIKGSSINTPQYWVSALKDFKYFDGFVNALYDKYSAI